MKLHQLAEQIDAKAIQLIEIAKALGLLSYHGGTVLTAEQQTQIAAIYRYMQTCKTTDPAAAIAQMTATESNANVKDAIAINLQPSVADELCRRYPVGTMSDRILKTLGALNALEKLHEQLYASICQQTRVPVIGLADELANSSFVSTHGLSVETNTIPSA